MSGALPIYDDSGTLTAYQRCTADADIQLKTDYAYKDSFAARHTQRVYSGRTQQRYGFGFGDSYFQLPWNKVDYENYTVMDTRTQVRLCDSFYLPVWLVRRTYEEYKEEQVIYTKQEARQQAQENLTEFLEKLAQKDVAVLEKHVMIKAEKNKYTVSGKITVLENTFQYAVNTETAADTGDEGNVGNESE